MFSRDNTIPQINLSRRNDDRPFDVSMEAFFEFSFWLSEELLDLVAEQQHNLPRHEVGGDAPPFSSNPTSEMPDESAEVIQSRLEPEGEFRKRSCK